MSFDRRKHNRFITQDKIFAKQEALFSKVGKVNDIGINGLSFSYLSEKVEADSDSVSSRVDVYRKNEFYLTNVHCKVMYDIPDPKTDQNQSIMTRRCGLYLGELSKIQLKLLNIFIKKYATKVLSL